MSTIESAAEPSMEEILASIRKIIAEEPALKPSSPDPLASNPLLKPSAGVGIHLPSGRDAVFGTGASRASQSSDGEPKSARPAVVDDLADLLEAPEPSRNSGRSTAADPWQALLVPAVEAPSVSTGTNSTSAVSNSAPVQPASGTARQSAEKSAAELALAAAAKITSTASNSTSAAVASPFPAMRKSGGFYPPPGYGAALSSPGASTAGEVKPGSGSSTANSVASVSPAAATPVKPTPVMAGSPALTPAEQSATSPFSAELTSLATDSPALAAARALDALEAGLAAVEKKAEAPQTAASVSANSVAPASAAKVSNAPASQLAAVDASSQAATPSATRTMEDVISDMLKPLLQQWIGENMPRLVEKALREEVAKSIKGVSGT